MSALFRTAKGALVISSDKSEEHFRVLTEMIERSLAESSRRVYLRWIIGGPPGGIALP